MIAAHRRRHRIAMLLLAPITLGLAAAAVLSRPPAPLVDSIPAILASAPGLADAARIGGVGTGDSLWQREDLFAAWPVRLTAYRVAGHAAPVAAYAIDLKLLRPLIKPDVLVYWSPHVEDGQGGKLPEDIHLLGRVGGTAWQRFAIPAHEIPVASGALYLYSLGHQELIGRAVLPSFFDGTDDVASLGLREGAP